MICWKCKKEIQTEGIFRTTECPFCHADIHSCKACKFYAPGSHFDCKEMVSEPVTDKEKSNFCDFFMVNNDSSTDGNASKAEIARNAAAALFGEASVKKTDDAASAKNAFNSLFGDSFMMDFAFLDSGTGGIPYLLHLLEVSPESECVYVGDTEHFPYGEKTHEEIVKYVLQCVGKIISRFDPKVIVIACNTISVNTLDVLREVYPERQFVGTVPAIKLAASVSKKRAIGLLATNSTINNPYNVDLKNHFAADCRMELRGDPDLISFIEHNAFTATEEETMKACEPAVNFFREKGCDAIVLGCTHFLNVKAEMQNLCGEEIAVVDSMEGVINRALSLHKTVDSKEQADIKKSDKTRVFITGNNCAGTSDKNIEKEYDVICKRYNLIFGGTL